jgi:drug/metabolite transporter (DMT)-like permease
MPLSFVGILFALGSSALWGGTDFAGGIAAKRQRSFQVIALAGLAGCFTFAILGVLFDKVPPGRQNIFWALLAGLAGAMASATLFKGLARGNAAIISPTSAVTGTILPVIAGFWLEGLPGNLQLAGIGLGTAGIWLVNQPDGKSGTRHWVDLGMGLISGVFTGLFFLCFGQIQTGSMLFAGSLSKFSSTVFAIFILIGQQERPLLGKPTWLTSGIGILDACANLFYLTARHLTRLDIAAVISSMYPAGTILLARLIQYQPVSRRQWLGVVTCLTAVALISIR